jgi:hypothetical protein
MCLQASTAVSSAKDACRCPEPDFQGTVWIEWTPPIPNRLTRLLTSKWRSSPLPTPWQSASENFGHAGEMPDKITTLAEKIVVEWDYDFTEDLSYFVEKVRSLETLHGEIRVVFGFG